MISAYFSSAQKTANPDRATTLKAQPANKNARIVSYEYKSAYDFAVTSGKVLVTNNEHMDLISLAGNIDYTRPVFYSDNVEISGTVVKYTNGKNIRPANVCGNYC